MARAEVGQSCDFFGRGGMMIVEFCGFANKEAADEYGEYRQDQVCQCREYLTPTACQKRQPLEHMHILLVLQQCAVQPG